MRIAVYTTLFALFAHGLAGGEQTVTVSDLSIYKQGSHIENISFKVRGPDADGLDCFATNVAFPTADEFLPCGETHYAFTLWAGEREEFRVMVYHEVGDVYADFRGGSDIPTVCVDSQDDNLADKVCTQDKPVIFKIKGPVRDGFVFMISNTVLYEG